MKKELWIALMICVMPCFFGATASAATYQDSVYALGIIDENNEEGILTRGEAASIAVKLSGLDTDAAIGENVFADVSGDNKWASSINIAYALGIVGGDGTGDFHPERAVSYQEFLKMMCSVLNYDDQAQIYGGYPEGYMSVALSLKINKTNVENPDAVTIKEAAEIVTDVLNTNPLGRTTIEYPYYQIRDDLTLAENIMEARDITYVEGIVLENGRTSLISQEPEINENYIKIGDKSYTYNNSRQAPMGRTVAAYIYDDSDVIYINDLKGYNTVSEFNAECYIDKTNYEVKFENEDGSTVRLRLDDSPIYVYNGRLSDAMEDVYSGKYTLIDNDRDNKIDVVFFEETQSFVVEKINSDSMLIDFADGRTYNGKNAFSFDTKDDKIIDIFNADGEKVDFSAINEDMAVTIMSSRDEKLNTVYISDNTVTGSINRISDDEIEIDGMLYKLCKDIDGKPVGTYRVGDTGTYVIDVFGHIVGVSGTIARDEIYGYVLRAFCDAANNGRLSVKIINDSHRQREVEVKQDTEIISWDFVNSSPVVLECTDDVRINGKRGADDNIAQYISNSIIAYETNAEGKIRKITSYPCTQSKVNYSFNAKILSFGGFVETATDKAFLVDEQTTVLCVPLKSNAADEDFLSRVSITDKSGGWKVCPVNIDNETKVADAAVIYADMDFNIPNAIQFDDPIYMVGKIESVYENDEVVYRLTLLYKDEKVEAISRSDGPAYDIIKNLQIGDLIRYTLDYNNQIDSVIKLGGIKSLDSYYQREMGDGNRQVYGQVQSATKDMLYSVSNEMVDEVVISLGSDRDPVTYRISKEDDPPVYYYDKSEGWIDSTTTDSIVSRDDAGDDASEIFLYVYNTDEVQAVVVIED